MTTVANNTQITFDADGFQSFVESTNEPDWLTQLRRKSWNQFENLQWPTSRDEEWMRTDIRLF